MNFRKLRCRSRTQCWCEHGPSNGAGQVLYSTQRALQSDGAWLCLPRSRKHPHVEQWLNWEAVVSLSEWKTPRWRVCVNLWPAVLGLGSRKSWVKSLGLPTAGQLGWEKGGREAAGAWGAELSFCQHFLDNIQPQPTHSTVSLTVTGSSEF